MSGDKMTDEERRARALSLDEAAEKIKAEYGEALAALGCIPVIQRIWPYTVEEHVENARQRGITIDPAGQHIQREYLDLLRGASKTELNIVVSVLTKLLDFDRLRSTDHQRFVNEIICVLSHAETLGTLRRCRETE